MKKIFIFFFIVSVSSSYPQFIKDYGVKVGGTMSRLKWEYSQSLHISNFEPDNKVGFNFGVFAEFLDVSYLRIVTELNFVQKGTQKELPVTAADSPDGNGNTVLWKLGINYLNLSILLKPNIELGIIKPYLLVGPRFDYEINKSVSNDELSSFDDYKKSRFGIKLGLGSEVKAIGKRFLFEFVYDHDFSEIYKNENVNVTTSSFDFRIGIFL